MDVSRNEMISIHQAICFLLSSIRVVVEGWGLQKRKWWGIKQVLTENKPRHPGSGAS